MQIEIMIASEEPRNISITMFDALQNLIVIILVHLDPKASISKIVWDRIIRFTSPYAHELSANLEDQQFL